MTDQYAVFGNPINHSKSPMIHELFAKQTGQDIHYTKKEIPLGEFVNAAKKFFDEGGKGLNVTVPFKLDAFAFAEQNGSISERAKLAGAVNTLKKTADGKIFGDNTDGVGLVRDITQNLGWEIKGKNILILGAGGAVRGVMALLLEQEPKSITIRSRTTQKSEDIRNIFVNDKIPVYAWSPDDAYFVSPPAGYDLVISGTFAGLLDNSEDWFASIEVATHIKLSTDCCGYDMMYGKNVSDFIGAMKHREKKWADGLGMLVEQAAESFKIWRERRGNPINLDTKSVIDYVRKQL